MKKLLIAILCLGVVLAGGFAACRGHGTWKQNTCQITIAKSSDSLRMPGIGASTAVSQVGSAPLAERRGFGEMASTVVSHVGPFIAEDVKFAGAVSFPVKQISENEAHFLPTAHLDPMALQLQSTLNPAQAAAPPASDLTIVLTGAGALGLLLFGAAIHPRRFTVLWIGR